MYYPLHYRQTDIPIHITDIIWEAIVLVPRPAGMVDALKLAAAVPTVEEWLDAVRHSKRDIAPGMDEVTLLSEMQKRKMVPEEWKKH